MPETPVAASDLLTADEVAWLRRALLEWGGPARCGDELAVGMGFEGVQDRSTNMAGCVPNSEEAFR